MKNGGVSEMARFDVHRNSGVSSGSVPFLLNIQSPLLDDLTTRIVVPLRRTDRIGPIPVPEALMPSLHIEGISCILDTPQLAAVPFRILGPVVANLEPDHEVIVRATDFLFQGF